MAQYEHDVELRLLKDGCQKIAPMHITLQVAMKTLHVRNMPQFGNMPQPRFQGLSSSLRMRLNRPQFFEKSWFEISQIYMNMFD